MCEESGCLKNVWEIRPGVSLDSVKPKDLIIYNGRKRMVIGVLGNANFYTAERGADNIVSPQTLMGYNVEIGEFEYDVTWDTRLSRHSVIDQNINQSMLEAGL